MLRRATVTCLTLLLLALVTPAQEHHHSEPSNLQGLGDVDFPISCSAADQRDFNRAMALMHSFSYTAARSTFHAIGNRDSSCAMAYWGEAMGMYRQIWDWPSAIQEAYGFWLMLRARMAPIKTARERAYIDAAASFYSGNPFQSYESRRAAYSDAMRRVHELVPGDDEAALLYALSLLSSPDLSKNHFALARQAVALIKPVYERHPNHPGAAHYFIHACDNPMMASEALEAANHYAQIAPASPHAVHMPSHIFARLGMWPEDIHSNSASVVVARQQHAATDMIHAMDFLEYAYLQQGNYAAAERIMREALQPRQEELTDMPFLYQYVRVNFPAIYFLERREWQKALALTVPEDGPLGVQATAYWAHAVAAGHLKNAAAARAAVTGYDAKFDAVANSRHAFLAEGMKGERDEAHAWLAFAEGRTSESLQLLSALANKQDRVGKREVELPAREMLGDILREVGRPAAALAQYELCLKVDPNRLNSLLGAARSAEASGNARAAYLRYRELLTTRAGIDSPATLEAAAYVRQRPSAQDPRAFPKSRHVGLALLPRAYH